MDRLMSQAQTLTPYSNHLTSREELPKETFIAEESFEAAPVSDVVLDFDELLDEFDEGYGNGRETVNE